MIFFSLAELKPKRNFLHGLTRQNFRFKPIRFSNQSVSRIVSANHGATTRAITKEALFGLSFFITFTSHKTLSELFKNELLLKILTKTNNVVYNQPK